VRKLAPSGGWQTTAAAVAWRVVEEWRTNRRTRWKTKKLYKRRTSVTKRRDLQVQ
jgi:hypothetical protein